MQQVEIKREEIYNYFEESDSCQKFFLATAQAARYAAYYTSMYLLQDTTESLMVHRCKGFSSNSLEAYIEFWGVMQALFIQQDSISELYEAVIGSALNTRNLKSWQELRNLRNTCAGHPAKKNRPKTSPLTRTFMSRGFGSYSAIKYEQWQNGAISHPAINLGDLINKYAIEAGLQLAEILKYMKLQWP